MNLQKAIKLLEQEYERAQKMCWIHNPLAWALYRVWKKADGQKDWDEDCIRDCNHCWKTKLSVAHGHWEESIDNGTTMHVCSVCGARVVKGLYEYDNPNLYCYHCGAKMDGG